MKKYGLQVPKATSVLPFWNCWRVWNISFFRRIFTRLILPKSMKSHSSFMSTVPTLSSTAPV